MKDLLQGIKPTLLMGPGPSTVSDAVYAALAKPTIDVKRSIFLASKM